MAYSEMEIERIGRRAFELARLRGKKLASVDTVSYTHLDVYKRQPCRHSQERTMTSYTLSPR